MEEKKYYTLIQTSNKFNNKKVCLVKVKSFITSVGRTILIKILNNFISNFIRFNILSLFIKKVIKIYKE